MSLEQGFIQAIIEEPDDDAHRLIFADWLEERGDPRGEFIRIQCQRSRTRFDDLSQARHWVREQELLALYEKDWIAPLRPWVREWRFERGFVEWVRIPADYAVWDGRQIFSRTPVQHARFNEATYLIDRLGALPQLARLRSLDLGYNLLTAEHLKLLAGSTSFPHLTTLNLACNPLRDEGAEVLATFDAPKLSELHLYRTQLGARGLTALLHARGWPGFHSLVLHNNPLTDAGVEALVGSPRLATLQSLDLSGIGGQHAVAPSLARSPHLGNLHTLRLAFNNLTDVSAIALAHAHRLTSLEELDLSGNSISDSGALALANSTALSRLVRLDLRLNRIESPHTWQTLRDRFGTGILLGQSGSFPHDP